MLADKTATLVVVAADEHDVVAWINGRSPHDGGQAELLDAAGRFVIGALPGHDERDFEFAMKYRLPIMQVVHVDGEHYDYERWQDWYADKSRGVTVNSGNYSGLSHKAAVDAVAAALAATLASCSLLGPNYRRPQVVTPPAYKESKDWKIAEPRDGVHGLGPHLLVGIVESGREQGRGHEVGVGRAQHNTHHKAEKEGAERIENLDELVNAAATFNSEDLYDPAAPDGGAVDPNDPLARFRNNGPLLRAAAPALFAANAVVLAGLAVRVATAG